MERDKISHLFFKRVSEEFGFLKDYGFAGPYIRQEPTEDMIWFLGQHLAIEFHLDWHDQALDCYLTCLIEGQMPQGGYVDETGRQVRVRLDSWLLLRQVSKTAVISAKRMKRRLSGEARILHEIENLSRYASLLKEYGHFILEDDPESFEKIAKDIKKSGF